MKKSTLAIFKLHGLRVDRAIHNYVYFACYDRYVKVFLAAGRFLVARFGSSRLVRRAFYGVYQNYHAKVLSPVDARKIVSLDRDISITAEKAKRVIPFNAANNIIFKEPEIIAVMDCPCRLSRAEPCQPVNVCMAVGRTLADFWLEHCAAYHVRRVTQSEALVLLEESVRSNRVITAWLKTETGGRTGVICSCCSCCCGGIEGMRLARRLPGTPALSNIASSGYTVQTDGGACTSCGACVRTCAFGANQVGSGGIEYDSGLCLGCGVCANNCPSGARRLVRDEAKGLPLDIELLQADIIT